MNSNDVGNPVAESGPHTGPGAPTRPVRGAAADPLDPRGGIDAAVRRLRDHRIHRKRHG
ncbi:hypothetical protein [Nocardia veterana]|uniref:Uncharacterized protein n=1 Tax=Nocardia veterana TaxID=132249 RepID=A0A7X6M0C0_9NOCA|nr:hypothetical protein [Nocardia veterana]NKY87954.1 hypothetical protein [Nocardia veterana]